MAILRYADPASPRHPAWPRTLMTQSQIAILAIVEGAAELLTASSSTLVSIAKQRTGLDLHRATSWLYAAVALAALW